MTCEEMEADTLNIGRSPRVANSLISGVPCCAGRGAHNDVRGDGGGRFKCCQQLPELPTM